MYQNKKSNQKYFILTRLWHQWTWTIL